MSSKYSHGTQTTTFDCDEPGCHANFETQPGSFREGWREAREEGWFYLPTYEGNISTARHYCPRHAENHEGGPRG